MSVSLSPDADRWHSLSSPGNQAEVAFLLPFKDLGCYMEEIYSSY